MVDDIGRVKETHLKRSFSAVLAGFLAFFALVWLIWLLWGLVSPVLVGLLLAFVANPVVDWVQRHWRWQRLLTVVVLILILTAFVIAAAVWLVPLALEQLSQFLRALPDYADRLLGVLRRGEVGEEMRNRLRDFAEQPHKVLPLLLAGAARGVGFFASAVGQVFYWLIYVTLVVVFFAMFCSRLPGIKAWCRQFLPSSHRDEILETVGKIGRAAGVYFRTRLMIAVIMSVLFSVGWALAGVPYWFVFGVATAILNIIPYASVGGWVAVLVVNVLGVASVSGLFYAVLWPTVVYAVGQVLDGWVLDPLFESGRLHIHPVVVLFAVLAGGAIAGVLGMVTAIPLVAAWQITFADVIKPRLIDWANSH